MGRVCAIDKEALNHKLMCFSPQCLTILRLIRIPGLSMCLPCAGRDNAILLDIEASYVPTANACTFVR